jgi:hypothetical protein
VQLHAPSVLSDSRVESNGVSFLGVPEISEEFWLVLRLTGLLTMLVLSGLMVYLSARGMRRSIRTSRNDSLPALDGRSRLSLDEFFNRYYAPKEYPRLTVAEVVSGFAAAAHVSPELLRPEDSYAGLGVSSTPACEQFTVRTAMMLRDAEQRLGAHLFSGKVETLDDHIRAYVTVQRFQQRDTANAAGALIK